MKSRLKLAITLFYIVSTSLFAGETGTIAINNNINIDEMGIPIGSAFFITVTDSDQDKDSSKVETVTVQIKTNTEPNPETITLFETGSNTGVFIGKVSLEKAAALSGDGIIQASQGDIITIEYVDPENEYGVEERISKMNMV